MRYFLYYLLFISAVAGIAFAADKHKAQRDKWRIPEATLHFLELAGGVVMVLLLMYTIHHKNRKASYFVITYLILALWLAAFYLIHKYQLFA